MKDGIFSTATVIRGEDHAQYLELLQGLHQACRSEGTLEETLVDKLATILWRHRRLIRAEEAQFLGTAELLEKDLKKRRQEAAREIEESLKPNSGEFLLKHISHPGIIERCLELLIELRDKVKEEEVPSEREFAVMRKLFGRKLGELGDNEPSWHDSDRLFDVVEIPDDERYSSGFRSEVAAKEEILRTIDAEIERLREIQQTQAPEWLKRNQLEVLRLTINEGVGLDRLVRYEASLERAFDRTLAQLERLQRMRLGQPVIPRVELGLNH